MEIKFFEHAFSDAYDTYLCSRSDGIFFQSSKYITFLCDLLNAENKTLIAIEDNVICGVFPLLLKRGSFGNILNSMAYYGSHGSILSDSKEIFNQLLNAYQNLISSENIRSSTIVENVFSNEETITDGSNYSDFRIGQFTTLNSESTDDLMLRFHYKTRNMIRKSAKLDIQISVDNSQFNLLKSIHNENMIAIGGLPKSDEFFKKIQQHFTENTDYKIYIATKDGDIIAALLVFFFNGTVEYFTPVIKAEHRHLQVMSLIIFEAISEASQEGFHCWNWGGTWESQEGVYRFKKRWGTTDKKYFYHTWLYDSTLLQRSKIELLDQYEGFYTVPFDQLK